MEMFAAAFAALYAAHHVGDYWIQTDHQARHKGEAGAVGRVNCATHVLTYVSTQALTLGVMWLALGYRNETDRFWVGVFLALTVSGVMHYLADRREHGLMFWLIRKMEPGWGKATFAKLGAPRAGRDDNPGLGTGAWALDQSWHLATSVFVPALIIAAMA